VAEAVGVDDVMRSVGEEVEEMGGFSLPLVHARAQSPPATEVETATAKKEGVEGVEEGEEEEASYDSTLRAIIGILEIKGRNNVARWIRAGGLWGLGVRPLPPPGVSSNKQLIFDILSNSNFI
jgi:hypothetical protein